MTDKVPHKWAKEIKAWADGAQIQQKAWYTKNQWEDTDYPTFHTGARGGRLSDIEYRIKPKPIPDVVISRFVYFSIGIVSATDKNDVFNAPNVRFTFDGETHKLKEVELLR